MSCSCYFCAPRTDQCGHFAPPFPTAKNECENPLIYNINSIWNQRLLYRKWMDGWLCGGLNMLPRIVTSKWSWHCGSANRYETEFVILCSNSRKHHKVQQNHCCIHYLWSDVWFHIAVALQVQGLILSLSRSIDLTVPWHKNKGSSNGWHSSLTMILP